jgi:type I restriction enzyme, S subunit
MIELPEGWVTVSLEQITMLVSRGKSPLYTDVSSLPVINQKCIRWFGLQQEYLKFVHVDQIPEWNEERYIQIGDILWNSTGTGTIGRACIVKEEDTILPKVVDSHVTIVRSSPDWLDSRYLLYRIRSNDVQELIAGLSNGSTNQIELSRSIVLNLSVPFPPLSEQKRIADKLEEIFEFVNSSREKLEQAENAVKQFRQTVLAAATNGKLTEDWREQNGVSSEWETFRIDQVATSRLGKMLDKAKNQGELTPYLRNVNIRWFDFDLSDIKTIRLSQKEVIEFTIKKGDVLICEGGEPGRCAVWEGQENYYVYQKALHRVRVQSNLNPYWLTYYLKTKVDSGELAEQFTGTTIKHFTGVELANFPILLPSMPEQLEIVRQIEKLFAFADSLEARIQEAQTFLEQLIPSVLAKAFRGELVPPDPTDEPASVLLERIKVAKALELAKPKVRLPRSNIAKPKKAGMKKTRLDPDVQNKPYLTDLLKTLGNRAEIKRLYDAANLELPDFYKQLSEEFNRGWLRQTSAQVEVI